jgi:serine/threonine protein kinase
MPASPLPEGLQLGAYRIVRRISTGGFSIVYLAQDQGGGLVAIKEYMPDAYTTREPGQSVPSIRPEARAGYVVGLRKFFEEGRILASIRHPNIVRVSDFFRANETVYIVMQYESGRPLQQHVGQSRDIGRAEVLSEPFIRRVFRLVLEGLREIHANHLLHLDIKPANIYLRMNGEPILLDFGAARQALQRDPSTAHPMYTTGFAPPELYQRDAELGPWTDVYSIGACIYSCMVAAIPQDALERYRDDQMPERLRRLRGPYSKPMLSLVERCLQLSSLDRPQDVPALLKALKDLPEPATRPAAKASSKKA